MSTSTQRVWPWMSEIWHALRGEMLLTGYGLRNRQLVTSCSVKRRLFTTNTESWPRKWTNVLFCWSISLTAFLRNSTDATVITSIILTDLMAFCFLSLSLYNMKHPFASQTSSILFIKMNTHRGKVGEQYRHYKHKYVQRIRIFEREVDLQVVEEQRRSIATSSMENLKRSVTNTGTIATATLSTCLKNKFPEVWISGSETGDIP